MVRGVPAVAILPRFTADKGGFVVAEAARGVATAPRLISGAPVEAGTTAAGLKHTRRTVGNEEIE